MKNKQEIYIELSYIRKEINEQQNNPDRLGELFNVVCNYFCELGNSNLFQVTMRDIPLNLKVNLEKIERLDLFCAETNTGKNSREINIIKEMLFLNALEQKNRLECFDVEIEKINEEFGQNIYRFEAVTEFASDYVDIGTLSFNSGILSEANMKLHNNIANEFLRGGRSYLFTNELFINLLKQRDTIDITIMDISEFVKFKHVFGDKVKVVGINEVGGKDETIRQLRKQYPEQMQNYLSISDNLAEVMQMKHCFTQQELEDFIALVPHKKRVKMKVV